MSAAEFSELWRLLNQCQCELIAAREAMNEDVSMRRLRATRKMLKQIDKKIEKLLSGGSPAH
jgi:hypothetical protein